MRQVRPSGALPDETIFKLVDLIATDPKDIETREWYLFTLTYVTLDQHQLNTTAIGLYRNIRRREPPPHYCPSTDHFDDNTGILWWLGTEEGKKDTYVNPVPREVAVQMSSIGGAPVEAIADRDVTSAVLENNYGRYSYTCSIKPPSLIDNIDDIVMMVIS
jgi:hypothetical protein